ncbi:MAG: DUF1573 domain-containing protein [Bacteroidia bacterium]
MVQSNKVIKWSTPLILILPIKEPLIITSAQGSCGCTVPEWPKEPIKKGETTGKIRSNI